MFFMACTRSGGADQRKRAGNVEVVAHFACTDDQNMGAGKKNRGVALTS